MSASASAPPTLGGVDDQRLGAVLRAIRVRRRLRQQDMAEAAGVSQASVSRAERGFIAGSTLESLRSIAAAYGVRVELLPRWRGGDLDRLLAAGHAAMHEAFARSIARFPAWEAVPEATYAFGGERGVVDVVCWHAAARVVLVVELKTQVVDINDLMASMDRRRRLAARMASERGWIDARRAGVTVAAWVLVAEGRTNRRRIAAHSSVLGRAFPGDKARLSAILRDPVREVASGRGPWNGISFLSSSRRGDARRPAGQVARIRRRAGDRARA